LASSQPANRKQGGVAERRHVSRQRCRVPVAWRLLGDQSDLLTPGELHNLSKIGLALHLAVPVRSNSILVVKVLEKSTELEEPFLVRIKHVTEQEEGGWLVGCVFTRRFTDAEFAALLRLASAPEPEGPQRPCGRREHRSSPRRGLERW